MLEDTIHSALESDYNYFSKQTNISNNVYKGDKSILAAINPADLMDNGFTSRCHNNIFLAL